jgi:hypothetical protein
MSILIAGIMKKRQMLFLWLGVKIVNFMSLTKSLLRILTGSVLQEIVKPMKLTFATMEKGGVRMADCRYYYDEFCVNDKCPMCADYCPVPDTPDVCKHEDRGDDNEQTTRYSG